MDCKEFPVSFLLKFSSIECKIYHLMKNPNQIVMWKFRVESAKIKSGNLFCFLFGIYLIELFKNWEGILNHPKLVVVFVKGTLVMKRTNLIKDMTEDFGNNVTNWLGTTFRRCYNKALSAWLIMHFWHPIDGR